MTLWINKDTSLEQLNKFNSQTAMEVLEIEFTKIGENYLEATMPVGPKTVQPMGLLHGGASCLLAETLGSVASNMCIDLDTHFAVGSHIDARHLRPVKSGQTVTGRAKPVHVGKSTHIWEIKILNEQEKLVCLSHLTVAIKEKRPKD